MRWFGLVLSGFVILTSACGSGTSGEGAAETDATTDPIRGVLATEFAPALLRDLPLLKEEEADCISDAILMEMPDTGTALEDPNTFAAEMVTAAQVAQDRCLTSDRILELGGSASAGRELEPGEEAFLLAVKEIGDGWNTEDQDLVEAGELACGLAKASGSLDTLVTLLATNPAASAHTAANLAPLLGRVLRVEELIVFSTAAVMSLCPEFRNR